MERLTIDGDETTALRPTGETRCGWCGRETEPDRCRACGRDPLLPYRQRGAAPPVVEHSPGRPSLDARSVRARYDQAVRELGPDATVEAIAEWLNVSPRTVRRWRERL